MESLKICKKLLAALTLVILLLIGTIIFSFVRLWKLNDRTYFLYSEYYPAHYMEQINVNIARLETLAYKMVTDDYLDLEKAKENTTALFAEMKEHSNNSKNFLYTDRDFKIMEDLDETLNELESQYEMLLTMVNANKTDEALIFMKETLSPKILNVTTYISQINKYLLMKSMDTKDRLDELIAQTKIILIIFGVVGIGICVFFAVRIFCKVAGFVIRSADDFQRQKD